MNIFPIQAVLPNLSKIEVNDAFFETVKEEYPKYVAQNLFYLSSFKGIYIYEISTPNNLHYGIIAALDLDDVRNGKVKKHEKTLIAKEKTQLNLLIERGAMVKPVLLTYPKLDTLQDLMQELIQQNPVFHEVFFPESEQKHRFWLIKEISDIQKIQSEFKKIEKLYVADGHHRLTANLHFEEKAQELHINEKFNEVFCAFFADYQLNIAAFNRLVKAITIPTEEIIQKIKEFADLIDSSTNYPQQKGEWKMCIDSEWTTWRWKEPILNFRGKGKVNLDVDILNEFVFKQIFNIEDIRKDKRLAYLDASYQFNDLINESKKGIVFSLYPVEIHDLFKIADEDGTMPPKSTWFEPRMKNGLLVQEIPEVFRSKSFD